VGREASKDGESVIVRRRRRDVRIRKSIELFSTVERHWNHKLTSHIVKALIFDIIFRFLRML